jgi:outer membrane scaffolding protein for murein synthesis (MipA/OmpV family)
MATRKDTLEGGLSFEWEAPWADLSVSWLGDATRAARGTSLNAELEKELLDGTVWSLTALAGVDRISGRTANYYLGVRPEEATALRTAYQPGSSTHLLGGMKGRLRLEPGHAITFGTYVTRLGTREAASPIVETRQARLFWLGYAWDL